MKNWGRRTKMTRENGPVLQLKCFSHLFRRPLYIAARVRLRVDLGTSLFQRSFERVRRPRDQRGTPRHSLGRLAGKYPGARIALEVGCHSPWVGRFLKQQALDVIVANARRLRAICLNERKTDEINAWMLARIVPLVAAVNKSNGWIRKRIDTSI